jgi:hypothetical protein
MATSTSSNASNVASAAWTRRFANVAADGRTLRRNRDLILEAGTALLIIRFRNRR